MRKKFSQATGCGKAVWKRTKRGTRCVQICKNGQWRFAKNTVCARSAKDR